MTDTRPFPVPLGIILGLLVLISMLVSMPAFPATYVVDPAGNDASLGNSSAPWRTVHRAAAAATAGDVVVIHAGTYVESVYLSHSGTADNPIVFSADPGAVLMSPNPTASMEAFSLSPGIGYINLLGIEATGGFAETVFLRTGTHDITIGQCNLYGNKAGIIMGGASHITVDHCSIHDNSTLGIRFAAGTHDVLVTDTDSFMNGTPTVCSSSVDGFAAEANTSALTFTRVRAYGNGGDGFDLQSDQLTLNDVTSNGNACTGIKLYQNVVVHGCLVFSNARGVAVTSLAGGSLADIAQCTVAANAGVALDLTKPKLSGVTFAVQLHNNILTSDVKVFQYVSAAAVSEDHDIVFRPTAYDPVIAQIGTYRFTGHDINTGLWTMRTHQGDGTLAVDPLFVDAAHGDFRVVATSPAVGRGAALDGAVPPINLGLYQDPVGPINHSPWADAGRNRTGRIRRNLTFVATGSIDPDGDALSYAWDFGDGSPLATGFTVSHAYAVAGTYLVTLTAFDGLSAGQATIQTTIR